MPFRLHRISYSALALVFAVSSARAQTTKGAASPKDTLSYELVEASVSREGSRNGQIIVAFGDSMPNTYVNAPADPAETARAGLRMSVGLPGDRWLIERIDQHNPTSIRRIVPKTVRVVGSALDRLVMLELTDRITPQIEEDERIRVHYLDANFPEVVVRAVKKTSADAFYAAAKAKADADLYFKGTIVTSSVGDPNYSIDSKVAYFQDLGANGGSMGARATFVVDNATNLDPDSVTAGASYAKVLVFGPSTGLIINADLIGFEFDKKETRNLRTTATVQLVVPSIHLGGYRYITADVSAGYEIGRNQTSTTPRDDAAIRRVLFGADGYLLIPSFWSIQRIEVSASWTVRWLGTAEPFTAATTGAAVTTTTDNSRHLVLADLTLMFNKALGASVGYRNGSEPPDFKEVRNRTTIGLVLKLKQAHKG